LDSAAWWVDQALATAERAGSRPEAARARLQRCRVDHAIDSGASAALGATLDGVATDFDELGMITLAVRTRVLAERMGATAVPLATRYLMVTDIVNSTGLNAAVGDRRWVGLLGEHDAIIRESLREHSGVEFKHTGDGISAWFAAPSDAVACAADAQRRLVAFSRRQRELEFRVRCAVVGGRPVGAGSDLFGLDVVTAHRLCAAADGGQLLVSGELLAAAGQAGLSVRAQPPLHLKGVPDAVTAFEVVL
jgi:class 3 adenylate cyclase